MERPRAASREEVGWKMRLSELGPASSGEGLRGAVGAIGQGFRAVHFVEVGFVDS
jgi:hypothetical protein